MRSRTQEMRGETSVTADLAAPIVRCAATGGITGYINAGGRGTRLNPIFVPDSTRGVSKALLEVGEPPIPLINHHINKLVAAGVSTIVAGVGDHHNVAEHVRTRYAGNTRVHAIEADTQLGNGGDLVVAARSHRQLFAGQVMISNCDTILDIDEVALAEQHHDTGAGLTIALTKNKGVPNEDAYYVGFNSAVVYCAETAKDPPSTDVAVYTAYRASSAGTLVIESDLLRDIDWKPEDGPLSLYRDVVGFALGQGAVFGYDNGNNLFIDVGTVDTWNQVQEHPEIVQPVLTYGD